MGVRGFAGFIAALSIGVALLSASTAQAAKIVGDDPGVVRAAQSWADGALGRVPEPPDWLPIGIHVGECPGSPRSISCFENPNDIYISPGYGRRVFLHELGHATDQIDFSDAERQHFRSLEPETASWPWFGYSDQPGPRAQEWFAEAYYTCAIAPEQHEAYAYGYNVSPAEQQAVCDWLAALARPPIQKPVLAVPMSPQPVRTTHSRRHCRRRILRSHHRRLVRRACTRSHR